jgi:NADH:ubiquinone oxidoreductase subunit 5 (subunit L)/multisubunit Na+/H+ antiporter MnhA subunit
VLLTMSYTFGAARRIFFGPLSARLAERELQDPPWTMTVPLAAVAAASVALGLYPAAVMNLLHTVLGGI